MGLHRPAEIFGVDLDKLGSVQPSSIRERFCVYQGERCTKLSQHSFLAGRNMPFGACSVWHTPEFGEQAIPHVICPKRFLESGIVFREAAKTLEGRGDVVVIPEVHLSSLGRIDYIVANYVEGESRISDFCALEIMTVSTTGTGGIIKSMLEVVDKNKLPANSVYGINYRQVLGRMESQLFIKGSVFNSWGKKTIWVVQDVFYDYILSNFDLNLSPGLGPKGAVGVLSMSLVKDRSGKLTLTKKGASHGSLEEWKKLMLSKDLLKKEDAESIFLKKISSGHSVRL